MVIVFVVGLPGCGKTTISKCLRDHYARFISNLLDVSHAGNFVEVSEVVREWQSGLVSGSKDRGKEFKEVIKDLNIAMNHTEKNSSVLYKLLYLKLRSGFNIVSGVREKHLLDVSLYRTHMVRKLKKLSEDSKIPLKYGLSHVPSFHTVVVALSASESLRRSRYSVDGKGSLFDDKEARALELDTVEIMRCADIKYVTDAITDPKIVAYNIWKDILKKLWLER